jgi:colicin import membrane protein
MAKEELALIEVQELKPEVLCTEQGLTDTLDKIKSIAKSFVYDSTTDQGRSEIKSLAYKVACSKKPIITVLKKESEEASAKVKRINGLCGKVEVQLDALKDEIRKPVTEYEAEQEMIRQENIRKEEERVAGIRDKISNLSTQQVINYDETAEALTNRIQVIQDYIIDDSFAEFKSETEQTKANVLTILNNALIKRQAYEKEQAENARIAEELRIEKERQEAIRKEQAAAQAIIDSENKKIQDEKDRIAREEREAKEKKEREEAIEKAKKEAAEKAIKDAEEKRAREQKEAEEKKAKEKAEMERQEALKPDKDKLLAYADSIELLPMPGLFMPKAIEVGDRVKASLVRIANQIRKEAREL